MFHNESIFFGVDGGLLPHDVAVVPMNNELFPGQGTFENGYTLTNGTENATLLSTGQRNETHVGMPAIVGISCFFCAIGIVGIVGNTLVIFIILTDKKMRNSVTNLFIMNLALSDLFIMLCGIPETVQFMLDRGWLLGDIVCKLERYLLVLSLYASVITLVSVCVERYIAIVHPMKAHLYCSRRRMLATIAMIWPVVLSLALPILLYNCLISPAPGAPVVFCALRFPDDHLRYLAVFRYLEFGVFYMIPLLIQVVCYCIIGRKLFSGAKELHRKQMVMSHDGVQRERKSETMRQRKGVVKMLIASVIIYFVSYSPHQVLLFYNTFSHAPFHQTWPFLVFVTAMGYVNSAANPILYCIFSRKFRQKFKAIFVSKCSEKDDGAMNRMHLQGHSVTESMAANTHAPKKYSYERIPAKHKVTGSSV